jgi:hypothetical protein
MANARIYLIMLVAFVLITGVVYFLFHDIYYKYYRIYIQGKEVNEDESST